jgi:hypothetical protein
MKDIPITPVSGYRQLTAEDIALMNENKLIEELALRQVDRHVRQHNSIEIDQRFVAMARSHMQIGFMLLNRAVAQPTCLTPTTETIEGFEEGVEALIARLLRQ